jgi:hypothetical protein
VLATGEKIALVPEASQLRDTLCISMDCVARDQADVTVATHPVKTGIEISVTVLGQRRLTQVVPAGPDGQLSSTDLVRIGAAVFKAIEQPAAAEAPKAASPAKTASHARPRAHLKLVARR